MSTLTCLKKGILSLGADTIGPVLTSCASTILLSKYINNACVGTLETTLIISSLIGAYCWLKKHSDESSENETKAKNLEEVFNDSKSMFISKLNTLKELSVTNLSKSLDENIKLDNIRKELLELFKEEDIKLNEIYDILPQKEEIFSNLNAIIDKIDRISQKQDLYFGSIEQKQTETFKGISDISNRLDIIQQQIINSEHRSNEKNSLICQELLNSEHIIKTLSSGISPDADEIIKLAWNQTVSGNIIHARQTLELLTKHDANLQLDRRTNAWRSALEAKYAFILSDLNEIDTYIEAINESLADFEDAEFPNGIRIVLATYYVIKGEKEEAEKLINQVISSNEKDLIPEAISLKIMNSTKSAKYCEESLSENYKNEYLITDALSSKYYQEGEYQKAQEWAYRSINQSKAVGACPCYLLLINILLTASFGSQSVSFGFSKSCIKKSSWTQYDEIEITIKKLLELSKASNNSIIQSICHYYLALIHFICGENDEALYHLNLLFELDTIAIGTIKLSCVMLGKLERIDKVIFELRRRNAKDIKELKYFNAIILFHAPDKAQKGEITSCFLDVIQDTAIDKNKRIIACICLGLLLAKDRDNESLAKLTLEQDKLGFAEPIQIIVNSISKNNLSFDDTNQFVCSITKLPIDVQESSDFLAIVHPVLKRLKCWKAIVHLLKNIIISDEVTWLGKEFFNAAIYSNDVDNVLWFGKQLRNSNHFDETIIRQELGAVLSVSCIKAYQLALEILKCDLPVKIRKMVTVYCDMALFYQDPSSFSRGNIAEYPEIQDIQHDNSFFPWINIPKLLFKSGDTLKAVDYAYALCHIFHLTQEYRRMYIYLLLGENLDFGTPSIVEKDTSIILTPFDGTEELTITLENAEWRNEEWHEFATNSSWGKLLLGHRINDVISIGKLISKQYKISKVLNKYVHFFQNRLTRAATEIDAGIEAIHVPQLPNGDCDFTELIKYLQSHEERNKTAVDSILHFYIHVFPSLYFCSIASSFSLSKILSIIKSCPQATILSAIGDTEEKRLCATILESKCIIMLTELTIEILLLMEIYSGVDIIAALEKSGMKFCVSEYLKEKLLQECSEHFTADRLYLRQDMHPGITQDFSAERRHIILQKWKKFINAIDCIPGSLAIDECNDNVSMDKIMGRSFIHSLLSVTQNESYILWEDDAHSIVLSQHFNYQINIPSERRIYTQSVFSHLRVYDHITQEEYVKIIEFLYSIRERFTSCDDSTIIDLILNKDFRTKDIYSEFCFYITQVNLEDKSLADTSQRAIYHFLTRLATKEAKHALKTWVCLLAKHNQQIAASCLIGAIKEAIDKGQKYIKPLILFSSRNFNSVLNNDDIKELKQLWAEIR